MSEKTSAVEATATVSAIVVIVIGVAWSVYATRGNSYATLVLQHRDVIVIVESGQPVARWTEPETPK